MDAADSQVLSVTPAARDFVLAARAAEGDEALALFLEVSGSSGGSYAYDMWFEVPADVDPGDARVDVGGLVVVVPAGSVEQLRGATLDLGTDAGEPSLLLVNPNSPPPSVRQGSALETGDLSGPVAAAVLEVLEQEVNPQIASHGGRAELVGVDAANVVYLRLMGGCQGCGLAQVTLTQGIAVAIRERVPEIADIVDVTAHEAGTNPYFESAKK